MYGWDTDVPVARALRPLADVDAGAVLDASEDPALFPLGELEDSDVIVVDEAAAAVLEVTE
jgi:hypothetical protein